MRAPLSPAQERLWLLQRLEPDDATYTVFQVRRLRGPLDRDVLTGAVADLVARHESLRTRFVEVDGVPWTDSAPSAELPIEWLSARDAADPVAEAERLVAERVNAPFDLAARPPVRLAMIELGADDHVLCLTLHHIVADGWSFNVLVNDLAGFYTARVLGREPRHRPLPVQPSDYARWQRRRAERAVPYWQERLADPPPPDLPFDRLIPGHRPGHAAYHHSRLPARLADALDRLARENRTTLFTVMMAAYQVLIFRHTGRRDILVGTAVAGRDRVELEPLVGYLTQTVVLRADLGGDPSFTEFLARTRTEALAAMSRPGVPFERFRQQPDTLMPSMFILHSQNDGVPPPFGELTVEGFTDGYRQLKGDLLVEAWWEHGELIVSFCHDPGMVAPETIARLAERFDLLLESITAAPATPVSALRLWTDADLADIDRLAGDGAAEPGPAVPELLAETAARLPGATAVACGERSVTFAELHESAGRLAASLLERGVRRGDVVGVRLPRSVEAITALLAIWRAGAAYLPLDPADPPERLAASLTDLAMTDRGAAYLVTDGEAPPFATVIAPFATSGGPADAPPFDAVPVTGRDGAYVISTSGSTGVPKGVLIEHGSVAARVRWMREAYGLAPGDRIVQFASLSFDTHVEEIFPALAAGATLVLLPDGAATLPDLLASPQGAGVTVLDLPTAYWHHLVDDIDEIAWPPDLRLVILGGEQVSSDAVARWRARFGDSVRLVNTYGPTEATVIATAADLGGELCGDPEDGPGDVADVADAAERRVPIGVPVGAASVHVLDTRGEPLPRGAVGELAIGGAGVARGYLGRPALTAAAFVPDPYGAPGSRRYLTGDRARWRADGRLEFLGRLDAQVKVRGFRIEPGEVESRLLAHPGVNQALVTARGDDLVAYVAGTADPADLRFELERTLPRHLVPTRWVRLAAFPLTTRGKIDRAALPDPGQAEPRADHVPPRTDAERLVAAVWSELLGVEVGVHDDFFALGGHSLLATRIAARLRAATGVEVPIRTLFAQRTVAELAEAVEELLIAELSAMTDEEAAALLDS
ncbi:non-ribosomal peptide synthetase [Sphaerimonospora mesophila]|uniref:non-ribosomal peptide synthetase n=1 Tax=Sphaerimonospora mesophila TaxID=37483 RepID=UPI0006E17B09